MSDKKISQLPAASDTDVGSSASYDIPVVVNGTTKKVSNYQVLAPVRQELQSTASQVTQLSSKVGDLSSLETSAKGNIVDAINEAKNSGGGFSNTAKTLLQTILNAAVYASDQSANISSLISEIGNVTPSSSVATPVITLTGAVATITCSTSGASIYYTTNGSTPSASSTAYSSGVTLTDGQTIKAIAIKNGTSSSVASKTYTAGVTLFSVTNNLTHCSNSNSSNQVQQGSAYSATITASSGYTLGSVACTMGGVSQTVTNGVISIASVTGDIVITASASEEEPQPTAHYTENKCFYGSLIKDIEGLAISNEYIPVQAGDSVEFALGNLSFIEGGSSKIAACNKYDSSYSRIAGITISSADGTRTMTMAEDNIAYLKVSFNLSNISDVSVKVNGVEKWNPTDGLINQ